MNIFPAIDIYNGCAVRLYKGDYARMTVYSDDPAAVARAFAAAGAGGATISSAMVLNFPHEGHLPSQRGEAAPHSEHTKTVVGLAIYPFVFANLLPRHPAPRRPSVQNIVMPRAHCARGDHVL